MHGTAPVLRSVVSAASQTTSKIPHLRCHIVLRQAQSQQPKRDGCPRSLRQQRCQSTFAAAGYAERTFNSSERKDDVRHQNSTRTVVLQDTIRDQAFSSDANMFDILEEGLRDRVLSGLMSNTIGTPFITQAHDQIFNKALLMLDPDFFIEPFKNIERHWKGVRSQDTLQVKRLDQRLSSFALYLDRIVVLRRESGKKLDLEACNHLMRCAASMGDAQLANSVLRTIMPEDGVQPSLESYNRYCQALVWSHAFSSTENYNLRVLPRNIQLRASRRPPESLSGHVTSSRLLGVKGIREQILAVFKECMDKGYVADELTFTTLMNAMGREADLEGVRSILKSVWNINVDLLETYDEEEVESPTFYDTGHPLRPSETLLLAVAHIFGSNNDLRTAWLLVDFVSRNYNLPVTEQVWLQLCEWALVLSLRRTPSERGQKRDTGQIPQQTFVQLVGTMTDKPHNIRPDAVFHWFLCRSWRDKKHLDNTVHHIQQLKEITDQQQSHIRDLLNEVMLYTQTAVKSGRSDAFANDEFYNLRRRYVLAFFEFQRNLQLLNVAVNRHLITVKGWSGSGKLTEWERRRLPNLIEKFTEYLPDQVIYQTKTGKVELDTKFGRRARTLELHKLDHRILPRVLNAMDTDDQAKLNRQMTALPSIIVRAKQYCLNCESIGHKALQCQKKSVTSSAIDYVDGYPHLIKGDDHDVFVLNPNILPRGSVPYALAPGVELEHSKPTLPFS